MFCVTESLTVGFKNYLISAEKSENTVEKYIRDLRHFAAFLKGEVTREKVLAYKKELCEDYAPASVNSMLSSLNAFFDFAGRIDLKVKTLKISRRIFTDSERELKKSEYERLLLAAKEKKDERLCLLMQTMAGTGIRVSELRFITCEAAAKGKATVSLKGRVRTVFLPDALCRLRKAYAKKRGIKKGSGFVTRNGLPLERRNIWRMLKNLCMAAGVAKEKVFPHNLRHLFARTFYAARKDIVRLADILGHASINTTRIYTAETGEVHLKQLGNLGLLLC